MIGRSKDHQSAGLWWSLLLSGGSLGGHGRLLKSFRSLIITFVPTGAAVDYSLTKSTVTSGQRKWPACLSSFLISAGIDLSGHGKSLGLFGHCLIFSVTCCSWRCRRSFCDWVCCGPLGNSPWTTRWCGGPASFIFSGFWLVLPQTIFFWNHIPYLLVNEENQSFVMIMVVLEIWSLPWKYFLSAPRAPHQERREKWCFTRQPFSLSFLNYFEFFWCCCGRPEIGN